MKAFTLCLVAFVLGSFLVSSLGCAVGAGVRLGYQTLEPEIE